MTEVKQPTPGKADPPADAQTQPVYQPQWQSPTRLMVTFFLVIATIGAVLLIRPVLMLLVFAFLLSFVMVAPITTLFNRTHLSWSLSVVIIFGLLILVVVLVLLTIIPALVNGGESLVGLGGDAAVQLQTALDVVLEEYNETGQVTVALVGRTFNLTPIVAPGLDLLAQFTTPGPLADAVAPRAEAPIEITAAELQNLLETVFSVLVPVTGTVTAAIRSVTSFAANLFLAIFVSFLVLLDWPNTRLSLEDLISDSYQREVRLLVDELYDVWRGFFVGQVTIGVVIGLVTGIQLAVMGIPQAGLLALSVGLLNLIPTIGGFLALVPLAIIPLIQGSSVFVGLPNWSVALLVVGINLIITQIIWNFIAPKILGDAVNIPLPAIIVGVFLGAAIGGILGAFLVAPILGTVRVCVAYLLAKIQGEDPFPDMEEAARRFPG